MKLGTITLEKRDIKSGTLHGRREREVDEIWDTTWEKGERIR